MSRFVRDGNPGCSGTLHVRRKTVGYKTRRYTGLVASHFMCVVRRALCATFFSTSGVKPDATCPPVASRFMCDVFDVGYKPPRCTMGHVTLGVVHFRRKPPNVASHFICDVEPHFMYAEKNVGHKPQPTSSIESDATAPVRDVLLHWMARAGFGVWEKLPRTNAVRRSTKSSTASSGPTPPPRVWRKRWRCSDTHRYRSASVRPGK